MITKRISAIVLALLISVVTLSFSVTGFSVAENLKINDKVDAKVGDKVTYEFYVSDVPEKAEDIQMQIAYDSEYLKVDPDSVDCIEGGSPVYNTELHNEVLFNSANGINGWDMKEKTKIISLDFEVLQGGTTDIKYYIQCFDYLSNSQNVDTLVFTTDFLVNGKPAKKNVTPKVNEEGAGGAFINFENGKGTKNGGDKPAGAQYSGNNQNANNDGNGGDVNADGNNGVVSTDENGNAIENTTVNQVTTESTAMRTNSSGQNVTDSNGKEVSYTESDDFWRNVGIIAIVALIVVVIVIKVIVDKKKGKKEE